MRSVTRLPRRYGQATAGMAVCTMMIAIGVLVSLSTTPAFAEPCPNEQLRAESGSTQLPDCRAYERVTPANKSGVSFGAVAAASTGDAVIISSTVPLVPGSPTGGAGVYVTRRTSDGWVTTPLAPPTDDPLNQEPGAIGAVGPDFSTVFLADNADLVSGDGDANIRDVFAVGAEGSLGWISQGPRGGVGIAPASEAGSTTGLSDAVGGATASLSHVVFQTPFGSLLSEDTHSYGGEIYDRLNQSSTALIGVLPGGEVPVCGASLGNQLPGQASESPGYYHSVSQDGTAVFFESPDPLSVFGRRGQPAACPAATITPPQLYVRINDERTEDASAPAAGVSDPHGEQEAHYANATPDGADVFFMSKGALTSDANTSGDTVEDLYEYDVSSGTLRDLSSTGLADPSGSQVQGLVGASEDGEVVYFVARGKLTNNATEGAENLYVVDHGHISYIAALRAAIREGDAFNWTGVLQQREARVAPDGSYLLLRSSQMLTDYANAGHEELYLYSRGGATVTCVSCQVRGTTEASLDERYQSSEGFAPNNAVSDNGGRVFFETAVSNDSNSDVYEWESPNRVSLIASGARFLEATPSGSDVFLETHNSLVPQDQDGGEADIYDARVNGGFPEPKAAEPCESNETCRGPGTSLSALSPASVISTGSGNVSLLLAPPPKGPGKPLTRVERLAKALKVCRIKHDKHKRVVCERQARKRYGPPTSHSKSRSRKGGK